MTEVYVDLWSKSRLVANKQISSDKSVNQHICWKERFSHFLIFCSAIDRAIERFAFNTNWEMIDSFLFNDDSFQLFDTCSKMIEKITISYVVDDRSILFSFHYLPSPMAVRCIGDGKSNNHGKTRSWCPLILPVWIFAWTRSCYVVRYALLDVRREDKSIRSIYDQTGPKTGLSFPLMKRSRAIGKNIRLRINMIYWSRKSTIKIRDAICVKILIKSYRWMLS